MTPQSLKLALSLAWTKLTTGIKYLFTHCKAYVILVLTAIGFIIYRTLLLDFLVRNAKVLANKTASKDKALAATEQTLNEQADAKIAEANSLGSQKIEVKADWNKNSE